VRHTALRLDVLQTLDRIPRPQPDRGEYALLKAFGERIMARDPDRQAAKIQIRIALMTLFNLLGTSGIARVV